LRAQQGWLAGRRHARSVRARYSSTSQCPRCGGSLRILTQLRGPQPGSQFFGCSNYPSCKYTRNADAS
jgi:ssDNA-binding Zn-finger/Zn-ribbon topoisomerase 1